MNRSDQKQWPTEPEIVDDETAGGVKHFDDGGCFNSMVGGHIQCISCNGHSFGHDAERVHDPSYNYRNLYKIPFQPEPKKDQPADQESSQKLYYPETRLLACTSPVWREYIYWQ